MVKFKEVEEAINEILEEKIEYHKKYHGKIEDFYLIRIQCLAKRIHPQYWKYRDKILPMIQEWAKKHPSHSIWTDKRGRKWKIGYGQQMHPVYGSFRHNYHYDILELFKVVKHD